MANTSLDGRVRDEVPSTYTGARPSRLTVRRHAWSTHRNQQPRQLSALPSE
jgi:hypothetical protein